MNIKTQITKHSNGIDEYYTIEYYKHVYRKGNCTCDKYGKLTKREIKFDTLAEAKIYLENNPPYNVIEIVEEV